MVVMEFPSLRCEADQYAPVADYHSFELEGLKLVLVVSFTCNRGRSPNRYGAVTEYRRNFWLACATSELSACSHELCILGLATAEQRKHSNPQEVKDFREPRAHHEARAGGRHLAPKPGVDIFLRGVGGVYNSICTINGPAYQFFGRERN